MSTVRVSRRRLLKLGVGSLLAGGIWPGQLAADGASKSEAFSFVVVNDTHYEDAGCGNWLERVLRQMKSHRENPDFILLVGDLTHHGSAAQLSAMRDLLRGGGKPVYVVIGNHDYRTQTDRAAYEELFPERMNYSFEHQGWQFVGLDTTEGQLSRNTRVQPATLKWLDTHLAKLDKRRPTVLFTHFPMGPFVLGRPVNAADLLSRWQEFNLQTVFNGHFHSFTERRHSGVLMTTNRCCSLKRSNHDSTKEKGYFLCHAKEGRISRNFVEVQNARL